MTTRSVDSTERLLLVLTVVLIALTVYQVLR
jgi:hypothetical protein